MVVIFNFFININPEKNAVKTNTFHCFHDSIIIPLVFRIENIKKLRQIESYGQVKIDEDTSYNYERKIIFKNNEEFSLSKIESKILEYFIKNKNKTLSIDQISVNNWLYDEVPEATTIRTYIKNLRKKLNDKTITTLKGIGYRFNIS